MSDRRPSPFKTLLDGEASTLIQATEDVYQIRFKNRAANAYLVRGSKRSWREVCVSELEVWGTRRKRQLFERVFERDLEVTTRTAPVGSPPDPGDSDLLPGPR